MSIWLRNCHVVNSGSAEEPPSLNRNQHVLIVGSHIVHVGDSEPPQLQEASAPVQEVDVRGAYIVPGLCDAHVHVTATQADLRQLAAVPSSLNTARAARELKAMLRRGFTTVRDAGGCDWGLAQAVEEGSLEGPRILFCGHALSQTGGHGDMRGRHEQRLPTCACSSSSIGRVCDGVAAAREAARDELRKGAHHIKIMASGGVASPTDRLTNLQFAEEEIRAIVEEARNAGAYVSAHAYTPDAIKRALTCGVRSIEHGNMLDEEGADIMASCGAILVPTLVTYEQIKNNGEAAGMDPELVAKVADLLESGLRAIKLAEERRVPICFGSDLLGTMQVHQLRELGLRARVQTAAAILQSATSACAKLFRMDGLVGTISPGAFADLLVVDRNPLEDITVLENPRNFQLIMKAGVVVVDRAGVLQQAD